MKLNWRKKKMASKIKITQKSTGITKVVSSEDAKAIQANKHLANKYKFEPEAQKPEEPKMNNESQSSEKVNTKKTHK